MTKIPQATKDAWLPLLEGGTLPQTTSKLFNADTGGYCCLGVLAKAQGASFFHEEIEGEDEDGHGRVRFQARKHSFAEIAQIIREDL